MKNEVKINETLEDGQKVFIQVTSSSVDGAFCAVASKLLVPKGKDSIEVVTGNYYQINTYVENLLSILIDSISHKNKKKCIAIEGLSIFDIDTIFITDVLLKSETLANIMEYNKSILSMCEEDLNRYPKILYCYNNSSNFSNLSVNRRYPGARRVTTEHWLSYLIDKYSSSVDSGVLEVLNKVIDIDEYMYLDIRGTLKYDKQKDMSAKNIRTYLLFYGIQKFIDSMVYKISENKSIDFTKTENYICYNFEKFLLRELVQKIESAETAWNAIDNELSSGEVSSKMVIIYSDNNSYHVMAKALNEVNAEYEKIGIDQITTLVAVDMNNKDVCIRYYDNEHSSKTRIQIKTAKSAIRDMLFNCGSETNEASAHNIHSTVETPIVKYYKTNGGF